MSYRDNHCYLGDLWTSIEISNSQTTQTPRRRPVGNHRMEADPGQDILNTWKSFLTDVILIRENRDYHCLQYFKLEEIEDRNI